jgi:hypothetical protein
MPWRWRALVLEFALVCEYDVDDDQGRMRRYFQQISFTDLQ